MPTQNIKLENENENNNSSKCLIQPEKRSLRLYPMMKRGKFSPDNIKLSKTSETAFIPIVKNLNELSTLVKSLFGEPGYSRFLKRYIYPKRFIFQNTYVPSQRVLKITNQQDLIEYVDHNLDKLTTRPNYMVNSNQNTIVDFTKVFNTILTEHPRLRRIDKFLKTAEIHMLNIIRFIIEGQMFYDVNYLQKLQISTLPLKTYNFSHYMIPIPVEGINVRFIDSFLQPNTILSNIAKRDPILYSLSLIRLLIASYSQVEIDYEKEPLLGEALNFLNKYDITFIFYTKQNYFFVNLKEIRNRKISSIQFIQQIKVRFKLLIRQNAGQIEEIDIDDDDKDVNINDIENKLQNNDNIIEPQKEIKIEKPIKEQTVDERIKKIIINDKKKKEVNTPKPNSKQNKEIKIEKPIKEQNVDELLKKIIINDKKKKEVNTPKPNSKQNIVGYDGEIISDDDELEVEDDVVPEEVVFDKDPVKNELKEFDVDNDDEIVEPEPDPIVVVKETITPKRSPAQIRRIEAVREKYKSVNFTDNRTIEQVLNDVEAMTIDVKESKVDIRDKSLKKSTIMDMERSYVNKTLPKDILAMANAFSTEDKSVRLHITDFQKENTSDQFNDKETWHFDFEDENQKKHHLKFNVPKIDENGFLKINGDSKVLKKQWLMLPIAKIKPDTVFISSNFNKVILCRQGTTLNRNSVILSKLFKNYIVNIPGVKIDMGNNQKENKEFLTTVEYDELSKAFHRISFKKDKMLLQIYFNQKEIRSVITEEKLIDYKIDDKRLPFAILTVKGQIPKVIDMDPVNGDDSFCLNVISLIREMDIIPDLDRFIMSIPDPKRKVCTKIILQSRKIPLVAFLGALYGLQKIIKGMKNPAIVFSSEKNKMSSDPYIRFKNGFLYYPSYPMPISLMINGLSGFETENYTIEEFENVTPYLDYLYDAFKNRNLLKGWTSFKELFLDPITIEVLRDYKLPTDFLEVFLYGNDLLGDNTFTHETDASLYRVRGYEVIAVELYKAMAQQYTNIKQGGYSRQAMTLPEDEIVKRLHKSFILENYDIINPINEMKSKSIVTFKGPNGINESRAFPLAKRAYGDNMPGVIGLAAVDSGNVGVVKQMSLDPRIVSTRGYVNAVSGPDEINKLTFGQIATPEEAALPFINKHDDPSRISFASGQSKHAISVEGSSPPMIGTGFEQSIIYQIGDTFAKKAKFNGKCISINEKNNMAIIEYDNGEFDTIEYGRVLNRNSNMYLGNPMNLNIKLGQKIKSGEVISYNREFFAKRGNKFFLKQGALCRLVIIESETTEEDSSELTEFFAKKMSTDVIKRKQISIGAKSNIISSKTTGDHVLYGDPLLFFEDSKDDTGQMTSILDSLGDVDERTLNAVTRHSPTANDTGEIIDMKVYWTVPLEDMSESCRKFVQRYINSEKEKIKFEEDATGKPSKRRLGIDMTIPYRNRIRGANVDRDQGSVVIEYYIGGPHSMGAGDKLSYNSSLKSIVASIIPQNLAPYSIGTGESRVDATLGFIGIGARMVLSIWFSGYLGNILNTVGKRIANEFFEE